MKINSREALCAVIPRSSEYLTWVKLILVLSNDDVVFQKGIQKEEKTKGEIIIFLRSISHHDYFSQSYLAKKFYGAFTVT